MLLSEYQGAAARTMNAALDEKQRLLDAAAGLAEEAGEVLSHVRKHVMQGKPLDRAELVLEIGDALWCVAALATTLGVTMEEVAHRNLEKLATRHPVRGPAAER